jgi:hypothetical protein
MRLRSVVMARDLNIVMPIDMSMDKSTYPWVCRHTHGYVYGYVDMPIGMSMVMTGNDGVAVAVTIAVRLAMTKTLYGQEHKYRHTHG